MILEWALLIMSTYLLWFITDNFFPPGNRPPGPVRFPLTGNALTFLAQCSSPPFIIFQNVCQIYGGLCHLRAGPFGKAILVDDFDTAKQLLNHDDWVDRPFHPVIKERSFWKPLGIIFASGESWKEMHRFSTRALRNFGYNKQTIMQLAIEEEVKTLLGKVEQAASGKESLLQTKHLFSMAVHNILWSMVSKQRTTEDDEKLRKMIVLTSNLGKSNPISFYILLVMPFVRFVAPKWTGYNFLRDVLNETQAYFRDILEERRKEGCYAEDERDFIDMFIKEIDKNKGKGGHNSSQNHYTDEQFITTIMDLFMAGSDTSSNTLEFALFFAMKHPLVQERIQEEIDRVIGRNRCPTMADRNEMPFTEATLLEVQRMANIIPITLRSSAERTQLKGYDIEKGTPGVINIYGIHMNPGFWSDPEVFRPERFLDENSKLVPERVFRVIPFGAGKRVCIGEQMARTTMFIYFTSLLQHYTFVDVTSKAFSEYGFLLDYADYGITLTPKPFATRVVKRP